MSVKKISSFLWFQSGAQEAVQHYASIFGDECKVAGQGPGNSFELFGQHFIAFDGGPTFRLNEAFSIMVQVENQADIDRLWTAFIEGGGTESRCGWLVDRFGLSWQITPTKLFGLLNHPDKKKAARVLKLMLTMQKLDLAALEAA